MSFAIRYSSLFVSLVLRCFTSLFVSVDHEVSLWESKSKENQQDEVELPMIIDQQALFDCIWFCDWSQCDHLSISVSDENKQVANANEKLLHLIINMCLNDLVVSLSIQINHFALAC